jgi:predicted Fe-S protein YdhL (DUF1289 family)
MISSPCLGECRLNAAKTHCLHCKRSRKELTMWRTMSEQERKLTMKTLTEREVS